MPAKKSEFRQETGEGQVDSSLRPNVFELHAVRGGVEAEAGVAGDEHVAGRQHLRALAPHDDVVTCEEGFC